MKKPVKSLCVLGALGMELKGIGKRLEDFRDHPDLEACRTGETAGITVHLVRTGVGCAAAWGAEKALGSLHPDGLICIGTAGGLTPRLKIRNVIASSLVFGPEKSSEPRIGDFDLVIAAVKAGAVEGNCLTVAKALLLPEQKAAAARETGAIVCEMEAWHAAGAGEAAGVPFLSLKAVSDTARDILPDVNRFMDRFGNIDRKRMGAYLVMHPDEAARSARFLQNAGKAMEALASFFMKMVRILS